MPQQLPKSPRFANPTEEGVWDALAGQLADRDLVVHGQRVTDHAKDHEADFLVAIEGAGVVVLEVKGGEVWSAAGRWRQSRGGNHVEINPVEQALGACYALREYVEADPRWTQGKVRWDHMVVLPHTELDADFSIPDCPRWKVIDRTQIDQLMPLIRRVLLEKTDSRAPISADGIEQLTTVLDGRGLPQRDVVARAVENEAASDLLTGQQAILLRAITLLSRVEIRGCAGSGKTYLAVEQARRLTKSGKRVALICYSHGLASYLERLTGKWNRKEKPAYVGEFHDLGKQWGAADGPDESIRNTETAQFWEHDLPQQMTQLAEELPPGKRFDAIIIDKAQDFADEWWKPMLACLADPETSGIYVFSDEAQRVFDREGSPPVDLVPLLLDHNLRNTRQIATAFGPLVGQRMHLRGGDGPDVRFVACSADEALGVADDQVDGLMDEGWRHEDIALLSTGSRHAIQKERQEGGNESYWKTFYVGLSRARDQLVICGDPGFVRAVGGPDLARRLSL